MRSGSKQALDWTQLLHRGRRKKEAETKAAARKDKGERIFADSRTEIERDHDRILFSTPVRRLADKTQVFPLEKNDSVRTRLTHSHEVSNLARSIGTVLAFNHSVASDVPDARRNLPSLCAAIGLVHDLGNPPFGHQGESAIQSWFVENQQVVLDPLKKKDQWTRDFLKFEGNAQGFRLVTRLQLLNDDFGLDLTYATLAAMMKYPTASHEIDASLVARKKHGFFASEQLIAERVWQRTGLSSGWRHPLAAVMEACDDIAYVVLDVEDAVKKGLASVSDLHSFLKHHGKNDALTMAVVRDSETKQRKYRNIGRLSPAELNDVSMQRFRVFAIGALVGAATDAFVKNQQSFLISPPTKSLLELSRGEQLRKLLKDFAFRHAYTHRSVLEVELQGHNVIRSLMDMFWAGIVDRDDPEDASSTRRSPFSRFLYRRISENYRRIFEKPARDTGKLPMRYRECLLLTDMISGMTDSFAIDLHKELCAAMGDFNVQRFLNVAD